MNFFGTMSGRWQTFGTNLPAKFLIMGTIMYLFGCFQGSTEALRAIQQPTHFTDFVISHSHLTVFGTFVVWAIGGLVYTWPKLFGRELWSFRMGNWSFWLITAGISTMGMVLTAGGLQQGYMWMDGSEWLDSLITVLPFWFVRTLAGLSMDVGISLLVINLMLTALTRPADEARECAAARFPAPPRPGERPDEDERPCRRPRGRRVLRLAGDLRPGPAALPPPGIADRRGHPGRAHRPRRAQMDARRRH